MDAFGPPVDGTDWMGLDQCIEETRRTDKPDSNSDDNEEKVEICKTRQGSKPHSTPLTLKWLEENYEIADGVCIPRSTLYLHYLDFCERNDSNPINAASFGKIIRQQFPQITTRRLGTRGQSKYHYYGIGVRETSTYYDIMYSAKGVQSHGEGKKEVSNKPVAYSPRSKLGTLLPDFPDVKDIKMPQDVGEDKVATFLVMYRTHCQRILDTVIRANFDEVQNFLIHFWQGMPSHIVPILDSPTIVMLVGVCDSILYKAISSVLMPTVLQALPESLTQVIRRFAKQLDEWLIVSLNSLPETLKKIKFDLARRFSQVLRRQTSLNHLCQAARTVIHSTDITSQMLDDWLNIDLNSIIKQTLYTMDQYTEKDHTIIVNLCSEFEKLLEEHSTIESYIDWLDSMVDRCIVQLSSQKSGTLRKIARQFLLMWSCFGTRVIRDMTLHSAPSFGSFHLLHLMFDDYVLYLVESLHGQEKGNDFLRTIKGEDTGIILEQFIIKEDIQLPEIDAAMTTAMSNQDRGSVITTTRGILGTSGYVNNEIHEDITSVYNQTDKLLDSPRSRQLTTNTSNISFSSCSNYGNQYGQINNNKNHVQSTFDLATAQLYDDTIRTGQTGVRQVTTPSDWSRQQQTGGGENMAVVMRMNEQNAYPAYQQTRQSLFEYNGYTYDQTGKQVGTPATNETQYPYHSYGGVGDFYNVNYNQENSKRRVEDDPYSRTYKRQNKEQFYYDHIPNNFAQI
ncbi:transcription factor RFX4 isoform X2 [Patella vulgata]|uniref:transcription factor RFX4 isoform X2 n=1 Tax=Patella vulgata TaxID=6465 RepID=UPI002180220F|nr:transcription factor RFX4 isoform X2 [Patella vulgata]